VVHFTVHKARFKTTYLDRFSRVWGLIRMGRAAHVLLAALGWLCLLLVADASNQKGASISVRARWQGTPYLLEAAEFLVGSGAAAVATPL
jgi:hypothetical protein